MPQKSKLQILGEIVTNYSQQKHDARLLPKNHQRYSWHENFKLLNPVAWGNPSNIPYVAATGLVDAYSQLPERPDLAFNSLWSATNSSYNDLYLSTHLSHSAVLTDTKSIEFSLLRISQQLHKQIPLTPTGAINSITIIDLIKKYIKMAPEKNFNFVASYVLRGIAVEAHNSQQTSACNRVREILVPSAYSTFKRRFPAIYQKIKNSTGQKYSALCSISETACKTDVSYGIPTMSGDKARRIVHATGSIIRREAIACNISTTSTPGVFDDEQHWLSFLIFPLLYATRNTAAHGNAAARLNSIFADGNSVTASSWTFLFCYLYFSLILLCQSKISTSDLAPLYENSEIVL